MANLSQWLAWNKFISPAFKVQMQRKNFCTWEDLEISEKFPSAFKSVQSIENKKDYLERIEEQAHENIESNKFIIMTQNKRRISDGQMTFWPVTKNSSDNKESKFQETLPESKFNKEQHSREFGNLIKWIKGPRLGFGVFGDVIKAMNKLNNEIFAVKRLSLFKNQDEYNKEAIDTLKSEINVLKQVDHQNIIQYIGAEIVKQDFWIYLEYASDGSLYDRYKAFGPFEEELIRKYTRQILRGLDYLHKKSILHQDLKWANVLLTNNSKVIKISDFGCARNIEKSMSCMDLFKSLKGTIPWMAPEVLKQKSTNCKADIWSLGCTIIEMAIGGNPWGNHEIGNNIEDLFKLADRYGHPDIPQNLSQKWQDFLQLCFSLDHRVRPSAEQLLKHRWLWI